MEDLPMNNSGFMRGIVIGLATGAVVSAVAMPKKHANKKTMGKALKTAGEIVDNIAGSMWG